MSHLTITYSEEIVKNWDRYSNQDMSGKSPEYLAKFEI